MWNYKTPILGRLRRDDGGAAAGPREAAVHTEVRPVEVSVDGCVGSVYHNKPIIYSYSRRPHSTRTNEPPPPSYVCGRCEKMGVHWVRECPMVSRCLSLSSPTNAYSPTHSIINALSFHLICACDCDNGSEPVGLDEKNKKVKKESVKRDRGVGRGAGWGRDC